MTGWTNFAMGVALAWDALEDLGKSSISMHWAFEEGNARIHVEPATYAGGFTSIWTVWTSSRRVPLYTTTQGEVKAIVRRMSRRSNFIDSSVENSRSRIFRSRKNYGRDGNRFDPSVQPVQPCRPVCISMPSPNIRHW
ncbi:MAG: hypothetical protein ACLR6J_13050 [Parabacteroides merdae]